MQNILSSLIFLLPLFASGQTSVYHPFPESNASWNIRYELACFGWSTIEAYSIALVGDTTINELVYHRLITPEFARDTNPDCGFGKDAGYKGLIRQDVDARKVYYIRPGSTEEELLYDFTLEPGDTIRGVLAGGEVSTVLEIDSVWVGEGYRKRWNLSCDHSGFPRLYVIEGVGSTFGLIEASSTCLLDGESYELLCFQEGWVTLYPEAGGNCELITGFEIPVCPAAFELFIFPNPVLRQGFQINLNGYLMTGVRIIDLQGRVLVEAMDLQQTDFSVEALPPGTYMVQVWDIDKQVWNGKLISL